MRFDEKKFALEYEKRLTEEGYPGGLLNIIDENIKGLKSIIDVGAGTGFFSIPLAERGYKIVSIDPSSEMVKILKKKFLPK